MAPDDRKLAALSPGGRVQRLSSVAMAVRLLKAFSQDEAEIGVTAMAKRLGVAKSTVYRLATTLVLEGMLEQNPETERYRLGLALFGLGALVRQRMNVSTEGRPHLFELRAATNETVHLAILEGSEIMYVLNLESNQAIRMRADLGSRKPAFCTAEGLAMLAFQPEESVAAVIRAGFEPRTPRTLVDPARWRAELVEVRRRGYAIEDEQSEQGMRSIAAPIRDSTRRVVASVGLAGPVQRLSDEAVLRFVPLITGAAATISTRLGCPSRAGVHAPY
ncbi:MAG TPA: IclR family transcriptional regulator [Beijerinckiaceae bacterium]|nr:IclR family transcriptional regulator [Beijerinckiaceae bacterium]